jgi:exosortase
MTAISAPSLEIRQPPIVGRRDLLLAMALGGIAALVLGDAWSNIVVMGYHNEELSYVLLAPLVILWIAWDRRAALDACRLRGQWVGVALLAASWATWWYGYVTDPVIWRAAAVLTAIGAFVAAAGRDVLLRFAPAFVACAFLIPISPNGRYRLAVPLQQATAVATQTVCDLVGIDVARSNNLLTINGVDVTVAEACNGTRMIITLFLVCYVVAFTTRMRWWLRALLLLASPLVAVVSNVIRLVPTVWFFGNSSVETAERFHDVSGWVMTVLSFLFLMGLFRCLERLVDSFSSHPTSAQNP